VLVPRSLAASVSPARPVHAWINVLSGPTVRWGEEEQGTRTIDGRNSNSVWPHRCGQTRQAGRPPAPGRGRCPLGLHELFARRGGRTGGGGGGGGGDGSGGATRGQILMILRFSSNHPRKHPKSPLRPAPPRPAPPVHRASL
jgi:hypothetical protein